MKAVRFHAYGGSDVLQYEDAPRPEAGPGEVLIQVRAAGVNPVDWKIREGYLKDFFPLTLPFTLGADAAGTVAGVGTGVTEFAVGDAVYGPVRMNQNGAYAEFVTAPAALLAPKPASLTFPEAASLPVAVLTAWQALTTAGFAAGQSVLVHAAAGGVGSMAVQLAKAWGASRIVGTASARNADYVRALGADEVIDYQNTPFETIAPVDVVLDGIGGDVRARSWQVLRDGGFLVSIAGAPVEVPAEAAARSLRGASTGMQPSAERLGAVNDLVGRGALKPLVEAEVPLAEAARALDLSQRGPVRGKIVLTVAA